MPPTPTSNRPRERLLFISLWVVIVIFFAIWKFWPQESFVTLVDEPTVTVAPDLRAMIASARVQEVAPSQYKVDVTLQPEFKTSLESSARPVRIGFDLLKQDSVLDAGVSTLVPNGDSTLTLPLFNPKRISAHAIRLYLAR